MAKKQHISRLTDCSELSSRVEEHLQFNEISRVDNHSTPEEMLRIIQELSLHQAELERHQMELEKRLARYTELYETAPLGYLTLTRDGRIVEANSTANKMMGAEYGQLTGILFKRFVATEDHSAIEVLLESVFSKRAPAIAEVILLPNDTRPQQHDPPCFTVRIDAVMSDSSNECRVILSDITDRKHAAEEVERIRSAFLSNVSHELRSPIHGILGLADLLKEPDITQAEQIKYIGLIRHAADILLHLVNDLIDISRIEAGQIKLQITRTMVNPLLRELHAFFEVQTKKMGLHFHFTTGLEDSESIIETDRLRVSQILINLIHNALKFTDKGSIHIGYDKKDGMLEFYCVDSGCGIPAAMKEMIFDRFQQVDNTTIRNGEGVGLGLNISKSLASLLGGTIGVESEEGKGSRFFFTLPYNPPKPEHTPIIQEPASLLPAITILLAEDDKVNVLLMKAILKKENMIIMTAENGQVALQLAENHPEINLVLMDINMPVMNGYEATSRIKLLRPELPIIAQTAFTTHEEQAMAKKAGCDAFIAKPIKKRELLELIKTLLER